MNYHFTRQEISGDRMLFALSLDKKSAKERILIGSEIEITKKLWNDPDAEIIYDETRPLGTLFMNYRQDETNRWTDRGFMPLWNALHTNRWKQPEAIRWRDEAGYMVSAEDGYGVRDGLQLISSGIPLLP